MAYRTILSDKLLQQLENETSVKTRNGRRPTELPRSKYVFIENGDLTHSNDQYIDTSTYINTDDFLQFAKDNYPKENVSKAKYVTLMSEDLLKRLEDETTVKTVAGRRPTKIGREKYLFITDEGLTYDIDSNGFEEHYRVNSYFLQYVKDNYPKEKVEEKIILPRYIDDIIRNAKSYTTTLLGTIGLIYDRYDKDKLNDVSSKWLEKVDNRELIVKAIVNSYEVEEPKFVIQCNTDSVTNYIIKHIDYNYIFTSSSYVEDGEYKTQFTQAEIDEMIKIIPVEEL